MYGILLAIHIVTVVLSIAVMSVAVVAALSGWRKSIHGAHAGVILTSVGFITGALLLAYSPALSKCLVFVAYIAVMFGVYAFGFGFGKRRNSRLLRSS